MNKLILIAVAVTGFFAQGCRSAHRSNDCSFNANIPMQITTKISRPSLVVSKQDTYSYANLPERFLLSISSLSDFRKDFSHRGLVNAFSAADDYSEYFRIELSNRLAQTKRMSRIRPKEDQSYSLSIELDYGISKYSGMPQAKLTGHLRRLPDKVTIWNNELTYQTESNFVFKQFRSLKEVSYFWQTHPEELAQLLRQANVGLADLLIMDLLNKEKFPKNTKKGVLIKMQSGEIVDASVISRANHRVIIRGSKGSLRSLPSSAIHSRLVPVFRFF